MAILRRLGNSTGTIIPAAALTKAGFSLGDKLDIEADDGRIVLKKSSPLYSLNELLKGVTPSMISLEDDDCLWMGSAVGKELISD